MTKPHFCIRSDGWIVHDGSEMPVPGDVAVEVMGLGFRNSKAPAAYYRGAGWWNWSNPYWRITAYRLT